MWKSKFEATGDQWGKFEITRTKEIAGEWGVGGEGTCGKGKVESMQQFVEDKTNSMKLQRQTIVLLQNSQKYGHVFLLRDIFCHSMKNTYCERKSD